MDYLNFDWKNDEKWNEFVNKNEGKISEPKTMEEARRQFYKINHNKLLNTDLIIETE